MSKRISNKRGQSRKTPARSRVRLGWKKLRRLSDLEKMDKAVREGTVEEEMLEKFQVFKDQAKKTLGKFMPKRLFRHQSR